MLVKNKMSKQNCKQKQIINSKNEMEKYEVIKLLGEGSFGRVYKAKVIADNTFVALKVICKTRRSNKEIVALRRECEIQRHLNHPNIIQMLDSFETPSEIVVVTEFAHKELNNLLGKEGYLTEEKACPIIWDLVSALNYLHSHRVLHRDLKPQNILIDSKNCAKLCDFGFARNMSTGTHVLTSIKGTPLYMAPELIKEKPYDYKADLWSLGCIMYELLVGAPPFCTTSILRLIYLIQHEQIKWPNFVSEDCNSFLRGLLEKDPAKRMGWEEILVHNFVKDHILICEDSTNMPLTKPLSASTLQMKEQQRKDCLNQKMTSETGSKKNSQDVKNNNVEVKKSSKNQLSFIEDDNPIEAEEWIVFLQKSMEEVINGEMTSLTQPQLANIIVSPLHNTNTNSRVLINVAKLLSIPFVLQLSETTKRAMIKVYLEVKLVPNLVYSLKQIMRVKENVTPPQSNSSLSNKEMKDVDELSDEDFSAVEYICMLITHLVHLDDQFMLQLCDSIAVLNMYKIIKTFLFLYKSKLQLAIDLLSVLTHILRVFPENLELIEKIVLNHTKEETVIKFVDLLRYNNSLVQERTCLFLLYLGKHLTTNQMETIWDETVRETLEALMYDSIESAADRCVDVLKCREFYNSNVKT